MHLQKLWVCYGATGKVVNHDFNLRADTVDLD